MGQQRQTWWGRNWKWFVPLVCMVMLVMVVGAFAGAIYFGFKLMRASTPYTMAVTTAKSDSRVIAVLGLPIKEGRFFTGNINKSSDWTSGSGRSTSGRATFSIPLHGPKGGGTLQVVAVFAAGKWTFTTLSFESDKSRQKIDLNKKSAGDEKVEIRWSDRVVRGLTSIIQPA